MQSFYTLPLKYQVAGGGEERALKLVVNQLVLQRALAEMYPDHAPDGMVVTRSGHWIARQAFRRYFLCKLIAASEARQRVTPGIRRLRQ